MHALHGAGACLMSVPQRLSPEKLTLSGPSVTDPKVPCPRTYQWEWVNQLRVYLLVGVVSPCWCRFAP